jgi:cephalosporin hydroxylase
LLNTVHEINPRYILEIGTELGGTLFLWPFVSHPNALIISLDLPLGRYGGGYPKRKEPYYRSFARRNQRISLVRGDSHSEESKRKILDILGGNKADFLFIDGDHTYEGVKSDYYMFSNLVRAGGIIALHDICLHTKDTTCEVSRFWNEIRSKNKSAEIIADSDQGWGGIGLIFK